MNKYKIFKDYSENDIETYKKKARSISAEIYKINLARIQNQEILESSSFAKNTTKTKDEIRNKYKNYNLNFLNND